MLTGIIAEYNPFHKGHAHHIAAARAAGAGPIVAVMSGNFVQRGEPALLSKHRRAGMALACGVDLVIELPLPWALSTAQNFAEGGTALLHAMGCVETLSFGSECADASLLQGAARAADSPSLGPVLEGYLGQGLPFAAARERAVAALFGRDTARVFTRPNDTLAAEYLAAAGRLGADWSILPVPRVGAAHDQAPPDTGQGGPGEGPEAADSSSGNGDFQSAAGIRALLRGGETERALSHMPPAAADILRQALREEGLIRPARLESALLCRLRGMDRADFARLPDISEGLENRLYAAARQAVSLADFLALAKTKRYSLARLRRLTWAAFLGLDNRYFRTPPPYIRVLGFNRTGRAVLGELGRAAALPLVLRPRDLEGLDRRALDVFQSECKADDLFWLAADRPRPCGTDLTEPVIKAGI